MKRNTQKLRPSEIYYDTVELSRLKYVKVIYKGLDGNAHEVITDVKFIGEVLISVYFKSDEEFNVNYPQEVAVKFVTNDSMYYAATVLQEVKKADDVIYLSISPPITMFRQQKRKYSRVELERPCVLVVSDENGKETTYLSKSVNLSASGILICDLETMFSDEYVNVSMSKYDCYHIILCLEQDIVLKLFARYVRYEQVNGSHRYAFQFMNMIQKNIDVICKYITSEQLKLLKLQLRYKQL